MIKIKFIFNSKLYCTWNYCIVNWSRLLKITNILVCRKDSPKTESFQNVRLRVIPYSPRRPPLVSLTLYFRIKLYILEYILALWISLYRLMRAWGSQVWEHKGFYASDELEFYRLWPSREASMVCTANWRQRFIGVATSWNWMWTRGKAITSSKFYVWTYS